MISQTFILAIYQIIILVFSIVIHETSHGLMAYKLGDPTAKESGRLSFNPLRHLDPWGSFFLPLFFYFLTAGRFIFGWAKPVPFNPFNLKKPKRDIGLIGLAGPLSNLLIAIFFAGLIQLISYFKILPFYTLAAFFDLIIQINIFLALVNLVPLPPLDGSRILFSLLPASKEHLIINLEKYGLFLLLFFLFFGFQIVVIIADLLHRFLVG